jgi:hypothetical protein
MADTGTKNWGCSEICKLDTWGNLGLEAAQRITEWKNQACLNVPPLQCSRCTLCLTVVLYILFRARFNSFQEPIYTGSRDHVHVKVRIIIPWTNSIFWSGCNPCLRYSWKWPYFALATGCVNPIADIVEWAHAVGAKVLVDACQSVPHMPVDVQALGADFLVASSHKVYC